MRKPNRTTVIRAMALGVAAALAAGWLAAGCVQQPRTEARPGRIDANTVRGFERLNEAADELYRLQRERKWKEARAKVEVLAQQAADVRREELVASEGLAALAETIADARRVLHAEGSAPEEAELAAARIRLAADAFTHVRHPMWLQYYRIVREDLDALENVARQRNRAKAETALAAVQGRFYMIRPALLINRNPNDVHKWSELLTSARSRLLADLVSFKGMIADIGLPRDAVNDVFERDPDDVAVFLPLVDDREPILWTLSMAAAIVAALGYVSYRMYRYESEIVPARKKEYEERFL